MNVYINTLRRCQPIIDLSHIQMCNRIATQSISSVHTGTDVPSLYTDLHMQSLGKPVVPAAIRELLPFSSKSVNSLASTFARQVTQEPKIMYRQPPTPFPPPHFAYTLKLNMGIRGRGGGVGWGGGVDIRLFFFS